MNNGWVLGLPRSGVSRAPKLGPMKSSVLYFCRGTVSSANRKDRSSHENPTFSLSDDSRNLMLRQTGSCRLKTSLYAAEEASGWILAP